MTVGIRLETFTPLSLRELRAELDLESPISRCFICTHPLKEDERLVGHRGFGATRHALHEECFITNLRQEWRQHRKATCGICRNNIINFEDYLPPPLPIKNKWLIGIALGAISVIVSSKTTNGPLNVWVIACLAMQIFAIRRKLTHLKPLFAGMSAAALIGNFVTGRIGRHLFVNPLAAALSAWMDWAERPENYATVEAVFNLLSPIRV